MMDTPLFPELFQVSEIEITYHNRTPYHDRIKVGSSSTAYQIFKCSWDEDKIELVEQFKMILLNQTNNCLGLINLSTGTINSCPIDLRTLFATVLKSNATAIALAHNHPSGDLTPSTNDIAMTKQIVKAAKLFGISVMDHLILASHGYFSFKQSGILPH